MKQKSLKNIKQNKINLKKNQKESKKDKLEK